MNHYDVTIIGAGVAGLSAALVLGRSRRSVLVPNGGSPRNAPSDASHGFFTRDNTSPLELLNIGNNLRLTVLKFSLTMSKASKKSLQSLRRCSKMVSG
jgi:thioredoxin reductase